MKGRIISLELLLSQQQTQNSLMDRESSDNSSELFIFFSKKNVLNNVVLPMRKNISMDNSCDDTVNIFEVLRRIKKYSYFIAITLCIAY